MKKNLALCLLGLTLLSLPISGEASPTPKAVAPAAESAPGSLTVELDGLVCSFCAQGLSKILKKQAELAKFDIQLSAGKLVLWPKNPAKPPESAAIHQWVEKAGLKVRSIGSLSGSGTTSQ
ncbi:MAG: hypothetical protein AB7P04_01165 [Bacteriovoracia bacterium]